jgi:hypothetical protein
MAKKYSTLLCLSMDDLAATLIPSKSSKEVRRHHRVRVSKSLGLVRVSNFWKIVLTQKAQRCILRLVP